MIQLIVPGFQEEKIRLFHHPIWSMPSGKIFNYTAPIAAKNFLILFSRLMKQPVIILSL